MSALGYLYLPKAHGFRGGIPCPPWMKIVDISGRVKYLYALMPQPYFGGLKSDYLFPYLTYKVETTEIGPGTWRNKLFLIFLIWKTVRDHEATD